MGIGELSLGDNFTDALLWNRIDNRQFLRCLNGKGLCLWRLRRFDEAAQAFERMPWLNPFDNQGNRFLLEDVKAGKLGKRRAKNKPIPARPANRPGLRSSSARQR
jgi:hypothetical protein